VPLYPEAGIPDVWLIDLNDRKVEGYLDPAADRYNRVHAVDPGQEISAAKLPDLREHVGRFLGWRSSHQRLLLGPQPLF